MNRSSKYIKIVATIFVFLFGLFLFVDQLPLLGVSHIFGIQIGNYLPNLGFLDPTQPYTDDIHHWMLGIALMLFSPILYYYLVVRN